MTLRHEAASPPAVQPPGKRVWCVAASLAAYAMLAPLTVAALAGPLPLRGFGTVALATSLLGPGLATILACWRGLGAIAADLAQRADEEPQQALLRLLVSAAMLAYVSALAIVGMAVPPLLAIYVGAALAAWLILLHCLIVPRSPLRRAAALTGDIVFLGLFLHWGDRAAAPWVVAYLALTFDHGMRFGSGALVAAALGSAIGFAAVAATTPVWLDMPLADLALFGALVLLPLYGASLVHRAAAARREAAMTRTARRRLLAVLGHELRTPLNTLLGMTALLARTPLEPAQRDMLATLQVSAGTLLGLIGDLDDDDEAAARQESFVLREALGGAVAILRPQAEAKGLELSFVLDPRLPHVCRGWPLPLRQMLMSLLGDAVARTKQGQIAVAATLAEREPGEVRLRLVVRSDEAGGDAPPADGISELFAQADESPTRRAAEAGLGRSIAAALVERMGGSIAIDDDAAAATVELPLACDEEASVPAPDLHGRPVAVVTPDRELAERLQAWIKSWRGDAHWLATEDDTLAMPGGGPRRIVVIDGRLDPLAGLSLAHRLATGAEPAAILFIAPRAASEAVAGLAAAQLAAVIEEPVTETALANAVLSVMASAGAETAPHGTMAGLAVLVADDDDANRERLKTLLERAGYKVELAADGGAALAALDKGGFDAALIELDMPGVSGDAVAKLHRLRHPGGALPLVALLAHATGDTEARCRAAGFDAVLKRPFDAAQLGATIDGARAARTAAANAPAPAAPAVTPISDHPRFFGDGAEIVRETTIESLRGLGGSDFLAEVVETFRNDAARLAPRLRQAAERGDLAQFAELAHGLRSGAANIGGVRLSQTLTALEDLTEAELRQAGTAYVEKIEGELARLELALDQFIRTQRRG